MSSPMHDFYDAYQLETENTFKTFCNRKRQELQCAKSFVSEIIPILKWIPSYNLQWFKKDLIAGITVAILLVPQSLAYAQLAGLPPEWGLYASIVPLVIYVIFGTSTQVSIGPVAPTAIMVASCIEQVIKDHDSFGGENGNPATEQDSYERKYEIIAMTVSFNVGLILLIFGILKAGRFITIFLSQPIMTGFISSAALIILIEQIKGLLGLNVGRYHLFDETLFAELQHVNTIHLLTTLISLTSLFILFIPKFKCIECINNKLPKWIKIIIPLFVILTNIFLSYFFDFESHGVIIVGDDVKKGFPEPIIPTFRYIADTFFGSFIVAIVSYMGSLALATNFEQQTQNNYKLQLQKYYNGTIQFEHINSSSNDTAENEELLTDSLLISSSSSSSSISKPLSLPLISLNANCEFIAYGLSNLVGSFFGAQAVSASFSRSALNFEMNAYTPISQIIQSIICLLCLLIAMPTLSPLPKCILSAVVTVSVYRLINNGIKEFCFLWYVSKIELFEFSVALIAPLIIGLEIGIFVAIASSIFVNFILRNSSVFVKIRKLTKIGNSKNGEYYADSEFLKYINMNKKNKESNNNNMEMDGYNDGYNEEKEEETKDDEESDMIIIELNAQLSYINSKKFINNLFELITCSKYKHINYIIISLALTAFIDTTTIRSITTLFQDLKVNNKYIGFTNSQLSVINSIKKYEKKMKCSFTDNNIKLFISTNDAITYFKNCIM